MKWVWSQELPGLATSKEPWCTALAAKCCLHQPCALQQSRSHLPRALLGEAGLCQDTWVLCQDSWVPCQDTRVLCQLLPLAHVGSGTKEVLALHRNV